MSFTKQIEEHYIKNYSGSVKFVKTKDLGSLKWVPETTKDD